LKRSSVAEPCFVGAVLAVASFVRDCPEDEEEDDDEEDDDFLEEDDLVISNSFYFYIIPKAICFGFISIINFENSFISGNF
jgi:hypothetical protein